MKFLKLAPIAIALVLFASCSKQLDVPAQPPADQVNVSALPTAGLATPQAAAATTTIAPMVQTAVSTSINSNTGGFLQALPGDYNTNTAARYPLILFFHGKGESGNGDAAGLAKLATQSLPNYIQNKKFPASFTVNSGTYSFIVISPQFKSAPGLGDAGAVLDYAIKNYRVDPSRIYIVGLSMGGGLTWAYGGYNYKKIAAIVPMCGWLTPTSGQAKNMASSGMAVWAFHNNADPTVNVSLTNNTVAMINSYNPLVAARKTIFTSTSHNCWTKASDPNYKEVINGVSMNIYEWLLQYKR